MINNDIIKMVIQVKTIKINDVDYNVVKDEDNIIDIEKLSEMITDYFDNYDYILGDVAYSHLRLKGFNEKSNPSYNPINDYNKIDDYIKNKCAFGCKYFIIERVNKKIKNNNK